MNSYNVKLKGAELHLMHLLINTIRNINTILSKRIVYQINCNSDTSYIISNLLERLSISNISVFNFGGY